MTAFHRFEDLAAMTAFAVAHCEANGFASHVEDVTIYSDDGIWFRPALIIVTPGLEDIQLRWNAFSDQEDSKHIGKRARVEAREAGEWFQDQVQGAMNRARLAQSLPA